MPKTTRQLERSHRFASKGRKCCRNGIRQEGSHVESHGENSWALLCDDQKGEQESEEKAITFMKEGLEMALRLGKQIQELNSKIEILPFMEQFPDEFPEDEFQRSVKRATGN